MTKRGLNSEQEARRQRLEHIIEQLTRSGQTQRQIANSLNVPTQYLSDVKNGQRTMTEPFSRRVADVYRVGIDWLVHGKGPEYIPQMKEAPATIKSGVTLPVLSAPAEDDPTTSPHWDGTQIIVSGAPAAIASRANSAYVLRFEGNDSNGRLVAGDLVLITEPSNDPCELMIVKCSSSLRMARREKREWHPLKGRTRIPTSAKVVGSVHGIVWAPLR